MLLSVARENMTADDSIEFVRSLPCFAGIAPEAIEPLLVSIRELSFTAGETIIAEGEPCPGLFFVKEGRVKLCRGSPKGEWLVRILGRGACFECIPLFDSGANPVSAEALGPTTVYFLSASDFESMLSIYPQLATAFAALLASRLRSLVNTLGSLPQRKVYPRLAKLLYQLSEQQGDLLVVSPSLSLNQEHLARMLGCSRQAVNAALQKLMREGIIRVERHHIIIVEEEALKEVMPSSSFD